VEPVVALISHKPNLIIQEEEVEEVFFVSLFDLMNTKLKTTEIQFKQGLAIQSPAFIYKEKAIWGATAMILNEMLELLK
jgi:hypothetical protein